MKARTIGGTIVFVHALAHAGAGIWAGSVGPLWLVTPLWGLAIGGFLIAAGGLWGIRGFRNWPLFLWIASLASLELLLVFSHPVFVTGLVADVSMIAFLIHRTLYGKPVPAPDASTPPRHPVLARGAGVLAVLLVAYVLLAVAARPVFVGWGTTAEDLAVSLPGDSVGGTAHYRIDHAITIRAPADSVWRWLVQIGQDRGGFYSYSWLERLFGADIHNATRIRSEWQSLEPGDFVRAVQPGYLGGVFGDAVGWKVSAVDWGRSFTLENWGTFALVPIDSTTTRFIIRTRGEGTPGAALTVFGPIEAFVFEPAHFIMQRGMMLGIRNRAEHRD